ncbi:MAG: cytochrome c [Verrucomicrobia bacterium]|nr:cytochrome c [Verrucomicrobiota bacterium]
MNPDLQPPAMAGPVRSLCHLEDRDEAHDVSILHAAVLREKADPREGMEPVSLWLIALTGVLLFWGGYYLQRYSGGFKPLVFNENASGEATTMTAKPEEVNPLVAGGRVFSANCVVCHQAEGQGNPATQVPPLAGSEWVTDTSPAKIIRFVLKGLKGDIKVKGETYPGTATTMPPLGDNLNDADLAAVLTYVRASWGNKAAAVTPADVNAIREKIKSRTDQWTVAEVEKDVAASGGGAAAGAGAAAQTPAELEKVLKALPPDQLKQVLDAVAPQK